MRSGTKPIASLLAVLALTAVSGCSVADPGQAVRVPGAPPPGAVDVDLLGTGNFPTQPAPPMGAAGSQGEGALIEARRLADAVVGPWEVEPSLLEPALLRAVVLKDPAGVGLIEPAPVANAVAAHDFIDGFGSNRQSPAQARLMNAVLRFAGTRAASEAAAEMAGRAAAMQQPGGRTVPIAGHPDALTTTSTDAAGPNASQATVYSFTAHGPYVLCQIATAPNVDISGTLVAGTLDLQGPRIDQFIPTDPAKFASLPVDPTGLLAHTMSAPTWPETPQTAPTNPKIGVYGAAGALHFQDDPLAVAAPFAAAGVQVMSYNHVTVYQTRNAAAARQLAIDLADSVVQSQQPSAQQINNVDFMPTSRCVQSPRPDSAALRYDCFAPVNCYTIEVHAADATEARQQTAAQYKMLLGL
jgi:hypothetical protein